MIKKEANLHKYNDDYNMFYKKRYTFNFGKVIC